MFREIRFVLAHANNRSRKYNGVGVNTRMRQAWDGRHEMRLVGVPLTKVHTGQCLVLMLAALGGIGCARGPETSAGMPQWRGASVVSAVQDPDSLRIAKIAADTILSLFPGMPLRVVRFERDRSEFIVGLVPRDSTLVGGGGIVRLARNGEILTLILEQ